MKNIFNTVAGFFVLLIIISSCKRDTFTMDPVTAPTDIQAAFTIIGQDASHPNGDSSGLVSFHVSSKDAIAYAFDWDASTPEAFENTSNGSATHRFTTNGLHTYTITARVLGPGGIVNLTKTLDVKVVFKFVPDSDIVRKLTNAAPQPDSIGSKTWRVDSSTGGHFGVGPYDPNIVYPQWYAAGPNEKTGCCLCFYTAKFTFAKVSEFEYRLTVATPNGAFTKTGTLANGLPGIPSPPTVAEGCYTYPGGTSTFAWVPASSGVAKDGGGANSPSTQTSILLDGNNTFIGYGALKKEYEILNIENETMYLRVQGTEEGNAWYLKLKRVP